jgi:hypothetical protein
MINLHLLTLEELGDEMEYIMLPSYLEENIFHVCVHFLHTWMCIVKCSMGFLDYDASNIPTLMDAHPSLVSQQSIFLKVISFILWI